MITKLRIVTTNGEYEVTTDSGDMPVTTDLATDFAEVLGGTGNRDVKLKADGIGWVAFNPSHVVAIEIHEDGVS